MDEIIKVTQLPIIEERLWSMKESVDQRVEKAMSLVCTEETIQSVKAERTALKKEFAALEEQRKQVKASIMGPYDAFESVYRECVSLAFLRADEQLKMKIAEIENEIKRRCEEGLREYFAELCAAHHLDWLSYERSGVKVDMASANAKTPKRLREQLTQFVVSVSEDVDRINLLENADEIMVEYKKCLNAASAICTVHERHQRVESEKSARANREAIRSAEAEMVERVAQAAAEYLDPPVIVPVMQDKDPEEIIPRCTFTALGATRAQLRRLKEFLKEEGIDYE